MNKTYFGDSYDIVKRFFIENLSEMGYRVVVDPMLTDEWDGSEYYQFLRACPLSEKSSTKSALLLDPDTGVSRKKSKKHVTIECIVNHLPENDVVFSFDMSFSRGNNAKEIEEKLMSLHKTGNHGFYYNSHSCFLFVAKSIEILEEVEQQFLASGLPKSRFFKLPVS